MKPAPTSSITICRDLSLASALLAQTEALRPMPAVRKRAERIVLRAGLFGATALVVLSALGALP